VILSANRATTNVYWQLPGTESVLVYLWTAPKQPFTERLVYDCPAADPHSRGTLQRINGTFPVAPRGISGTRSTLIPGSQAPRDFSSASKASAMLPPGYPDGNPASNMCKPLGS
jgi:hypothetical protein